MKRIRQRRSEPKMPPAWVLCCVDSRYIQPTQQFVKQQLGARRYFLKTDAGGSRALLHGHPAVRAWVLRNLRLVYRQRGVRRVILFHHQDCLAYGGSAAFGNQSRETRVHTQELKKAAQLLQTTLRDVTVQTFYASREQRRIRFRPCNVQQVAGVSAAHTRRTGRSTRRTQNVGRNETAGQRLGQTVGF